VHTKQIQIPAAGRRRGRASQRIERQPDALSAGFQSPSHRVRDLPCAAIALRDQDWWVLTILKCGFKRLRGFLTKKSPPF
jgi:hypothetical protein